MAAEVEHDIPALLAKIAEFEKITSSDAARIQQLETNLKQKDGDLVGYKNRITQLEKELADAQKLNQQHLKDVDEYGTLKNQSEDTLAKAKSMLFERTKVIKNQELQIDALNEQNQSLKDVVQITKDLLEIRNLEIKQLETKIKCMEDRVVAEKQRQDLMHKKLENMIRFNGDLKREYETQLCLFQALRERYNERELARDVVDDLKGNKEPSTSNTEQQQQQDDNKNNNNEEHKDDETKQ